MPVRDTLTIRKVLQQVPSSTFDHRVILPWLFVFLSLSLGGLFVMINPPLQAPDEFGHLFRAYGISEGYFVAPDQTPLPLSIQRLTVQFPVHLEHVRKISRQEISDSLHVPLNPAQQVSVYNQGTNLNTWIPYVPASAAILVARFFQAPPLIVFYCARVANLAAYTALVCLALRVLPDFQPILFAISLIPMVLHQAGSLSWDGVSFSLAFLFCAVLIRYAHDAGPLKRQHYASLLAAVAIISLCKIDFALLPLLLIIPMQRYGLKTRRLQFLMMCVALSVFLSSLWQFANHNNLILFQQAEAVRDIHFPDNLRYIYFNTGYFINAVIHTAVLNGSVHVSSLIGTFGWLAVHLPKWAVVCYLLLLLGVGLAGTSHMEFSWLQRSVLLVIVALGISSAIIAMWLAETPEAYIHNVILQNIGAIPGIQGRHFIPFVFPGLLVLSNRYLRISPVWLIASTVVVAIASTLAGVREIERVYYIP